MKRFLLLLKSSPFILLTIISFSGLYYLGKRKDTVMTQSTYSRELQDFRQKSEERLKSSEGWLTVVGLSWLTDGANTIGSSPDNKIILPHSTPEHLGEIKLHKEVLKPSTPTANSTMSAAAVTPTASTATIQFTTTAGVLLNEEPVKLKTTYTLNDDSTENPSQIKVGSVTFFLIQRKNGVGVRIKDTEAEARKNFIGKEWFSPETDFIVTADWIAHTQPKTIMVPDVIGNLNEELSPGLARFQINGETIELHPTQEGDSLFFVIRDQTSGKETYGASRFLYADLAKDGKLTLDFNKAVNPPCAFTRYATCPMPPPENIMKVAIRAGEKIPQGSHH